MFIWIGPRSETPTAIPRTTQRQFFFHCCCVLCAPEDVCASYLVNGEGMNFVFFFLFVMRDAGYFSRRFHVICSAIIR